MDISLLNILRTVSWDFRRDMAQSYANGLKKAIEVHLDNDVEKEQGYFLSKKGLISKKDGKLHAAHFEDKLYVGNIHSIENHLYWNDEELADDDQVINVVTINGPVTRDGGACSYGTKDWRDQILYADTIPQVIGHLFIVNSPGGESACRKDYDLMMEDWRAHKKPAVMYVDGMACSSLVNLGSRCDRVVVRNPKDDFGCIGSMAAFWATPDGAKDVDGSRYIEIVGDNAPEKNDWYRNAAEGDYKKLQALINKDTNEFHQTVRDNRPLVEDWMLTGNVFEAQELMPALVDEIGTLDRAIECIFELADGRLTPAREAKKVEAPKTNGEPEIGNTANEPKEQSEMSKLNEQQKTAMSTRKGTTKIVDNGHVKEVQETIFGPVETEIAKPQHNNNMKEEEKKAQQPAQTAETPKTEPAKGDDDPKKKDPNEEPDGNKPDDNPDGENPNEEPEKPNEDPDGNEPDENPDGENPDGENPDENPDGENPDENPDGENPDGEEPDDDPDGENPDDDPEDDPKKKKGENPDEKCGGGAPKKKEGEEPDEKCGGGAPKKKEGEDAAKTLDAAKAMKEKDSQIAELKAAFDKAQKENAKLIGQLKKKISDLSNEVKELSAEPTPMADSNAGIPASNETGAQPKFQKRITRGMSYEEVRAARKEREKEKQEAKTTAKK